MKTVVLTFDDASLGQFTHAVPMLNEYGMKGTFFICPGLTDEHSSKKDSRDNWGEIGWQDLLSMQVQGHEIGNHSYTHPDYVELSLDEVEADICKALDAFQEHMNFRPSSFALPFGSYTEEVNNVVLKHHAICRTCEQENELVKNLVQGLNIISNTTLDDVEGWIEHSFSQEGPCVLAFHGIGERGWELVSSETFQSILDMLARKSQAQSIKVLKLNEAI